MKTLTFKTFLAAGLLSASFLSARASVPGASDRKLVRQKIQQNIALPETLKKPGFSKKVKVIFVVAANHSVSEVAAATSDAVLKGSLEGQFKKLNMPELQPGTYKVEIDFNVY